MCNRCDICKTAASYRQLPEKPDNPEWTCWYSGGCIRAIEWSRQARGGAQNADSPLTWLERYGEGSVAIITKVSGFFPAWHLHSLGFPGQLEAVWAPASTAFNLGLGHRPKPRFDGYYRQQSVLGRLARSKNSNPSKELGNNHISKHIRPMPDTLWMTPSCTGLLS